jgi:hypothetical protein
VRRVGGRERVLDFLAALVGLSPAVPGIQLPDHPADDLGALRDDRVAEGPQSVHPAGNPISHSTHVGFSGPEVTSLRSMEPSRPGGFR